MTTSVTYNSLKKIQQWTSNTQFLVYDLEVKLHSDDVICACVIILDTNYKETARWTFRTLFAFCAFVLTRLTKNDVVLIAHNGMNYDHKIVIHYLTDDMNVELMSNHDSFTLCCVTVGVNNLYFRDTYKYMGFSLQECGKIVNLPKIDLDAGAITEYTEEVAKYCMRDVEVCVEILHFFNNYQLPFLKFENKVLNYHSQADVAYRAVIGPHRSTFDRTFIDVVHNELEKSYYGGRAYGSSYGILIKKPIVCIDIRSMYPAAMCREMPCGEIYSVDKRDRDKLGIYHISATREEQPCWKKTHAIAPFKYNDVTFFASEGTIVGWYCSPDIDALELDGWSVTIDGGYEFQGKTTCLRDFYTGLYEERKQHKKGTAINYICKILMNSSYGKFAQILGLYNDRPKYIAWFCLAYSRLQLVSLFRLCKNEAVYYGDTDSVYVSKNVLPLPDNVLVDELSISGNEIRVEVESEHSDIIVIARKIYGLTNDKHSKDSHKVKCKGVPIGKKETPAERYQTLLRCAYEPVKMRYIASTSSPLALRDGQLLCYGGNLADAYRTIQVVIPSMMYKCTLCKLYHTKLIKMC